MKGFEKHIPHEHDPGHVDIDRLPVSRNAHYSTIIDK